MEFQWQDGDPLAFQLWSNRHYNHPNNVSYRVRRYPRDIKESISYFYGHSAFKYYISPNLADVKLLQSQVLHPMLVKDCTLMLLSNLIEPSWITVDCQKPILTNILCAFNKTKNASNRLWSFHDIWLDKECHLDSLRLNGTCLNFLWYNNRRDHYDKMGERLLQNCRKSLIILKLLPASIKPILMLDTKNKNLLYMATQSQFPGSFELDIKSVRRNTSNYADVYTNHLFKCQNNSYISQMLVCDGVHHCPGFLPIDEFNCSCNYSINTKIEMCKFIQLSSTNTRCSIFYKRTKNGDCILYKETGHQKKAKESLLTLTCNNKSYNITGHMVNDLVVDCYPQADDEYLLRSLLVNKTTGTCSSEGMLYCMESHPHCYNINDICKFQLSGQKNLIPCRNGKHLEECDTFECNMMFKCHQLYCIPWSYVCDGKWDCPKGLDEFLHFTCNSDERCKNMFKCKNSSI